MRVSEYGRKWNAKIPRNAIKAFVRTKHIETAISVLLNEVENAIDQQLAAGNSAYTTSIRHQCLHYAIQCHAENYRLFNRVMKGSV